MLARQRHLEKMGREDEGPKDEDEAAPANTHSGPLKPDSLQVRVHIKTFQAFFLVVADEKWRKAMERVSSIHGDKSGPKLVMKNKRGYLTCGTRQLVVRGQVNDIFVEAVQKGRNKHRIARWVQLGIGSVNAINCSAKRHQQGARQLLHISPFEKNMELPLCVFVGLTTYEANDSTYEPGDVQLASVLEPSEGIAAHLKQYPPNDKERLKKMGFLKDYKDDLGRVMTFVFVRVGSVRALDHAPFRRRLMYFGKRGKSGNVSELVRKPSPLALDRELLVKLQRKVEQLTGKSNMLGIVEGVLDGVRARLVDHYNSQHVLCKEVALAPMRYRALRNGCPQTFHMQFHKLPTPGSQGSPLDMLGGNSLNVLPWKVSMLLVSRSEFAVGLDIDGDAEDYDDEQSPKKSQDEVKVPRAMPVTAAVGPTANLVDDKESASLVGAGSYFLKWGRNGKSKKRFIMYDENARSILWKNAQQDRTPLGVIEMSKVQDICTGVTTPVLQNVRNAQLRGDRTWSIVTSDRTLDLQAESAVQRDRWVAGIKACYTAHMSGQTATTQQVTLPKAYQKKDKAYQEKFRSNRRVLSSSTNRL